MKIYRIDKGTKERNATTGSNRRGRRMGGRENNE